MRTPGLMDNACLGTSTLNEFLSVAFHLSSHSKRYLILSNSQLCSVVRQTAAVV